ncbi:MAG: L,D-transpeptidase [Hyphomicrobiales bacterium]|nr:L,D-transpeptidase [Hyphomicrobiales bacterium]
MSSVGRLFGLLVCVLLVAAAFPAGPAGAAGRVRAEIDLSQQRMYVYVDGAIRGRWRVSTARRGYRTPVGSFRPIRLERSWYSRKYDWAPMPYSVFFLGGYAIHGTTETRRLGRPVSHGCVRLHPKHAATLFRLIRQAGRKNTRIIIRR